MRQHQSEGLNDHLVQTKEIALFHLLMSPRTGRTVRAVVGNLVEAAATAVRSIAPTDTPADEPAPVEAPDPTDVYTDDDMPDEATIDAAAREYERAVDQARRADRGKRAAKKVLDRLPAGIYGAWRVFRTPSSRQTPDLAEITRIFKAHGLGPVPMKPCAPSLKVERIETPAEVAA